jgi:hypothetical protein
MRAAGTRPGKPSRPAACQREFRRTRLGSRRQVCAVCQHEATAEQYQYAGDAYPCCSPECATVVAGIIRRALNRFVTEEVGELAGLTDMERQAIRAARQSLYDALVKIGIADAFDNCTADQIDMVIETVWDGLRASMHLQSAKGEMPW